MPLDASPFCPRDDDTKTNLGKLMHSFIYLVPVEVAWNENKAFRILKDGMREEADDYHQLRQLAESISWP